MKLLVLILVFSWKFLFGFGGDVMKPLTQRTFRVAVIGTGIGGSAYAYFLHNLTNQYMLETGYDVKIDIYEKSDRVGGRQHHFYVNNQKFETGFFVSPFLFFQFSLVFFCEKHAKSQFVMGIKRKQKKNKIK